MFLQGSFQWESKVEIKWTHNLEHKSLRILPQGPLKCSQLHFASVLWQWRDENHSHIFCNHFFAKFFAGKKGPLGIQLFHFKPNNNNNINNDVDISNDVVNNNLRLINAQTESINSKNT